MGFFDKFSDSTESVIRMARSLNADLPFGSVQENAAALRELVTKCETCTNKDGCAELLADAPELTQVPGYCVNRSTLEASRKNR